MSATSLPGWLYTDPRFFELERQKVFRQTWHIMGHISDAPNPGDYVTLDVLGDRGVTLSGGQRQRLCLARALLAKATILGLDDATSALDAATERTVLHNIRELRNRATVIVVSSKLSTILMADRVLLLADGHIAAQGTHRDLSRTCAAYRELLGIDTHE